MKIAAAFTLFALLIAGNGAAAEPEETKPYLTAQRRMAINRSLLAKAEAEYAARQKEKPSPDLERQLEGLRYKIQALQQDAAQLQALLPQGLRADEFMKDIETRQNLTGRVQPSVNIEKENQLAEKLEDVFALHEKALEHVAERRYGQASRTYEEILLVSPDDDEAYLLLGHCRLLNAEYAQAKEAFLNAVHIDPANAREITRLYENILVENPGDDAAYTHLGFASWILGKKAEAKRSFESALEINPANAEARVGLAGMAQEI